MRRTPATLLLLAILTVFAVAVATVVERRGDENGTAQPGPPATFTSTTSTTTPLATTTTTTAPTVTTTGPTTSTLAPLPGGPAVFPATTTTAPSPTTTATGATTTTLLGEHPVTGGGAAAGPVLACVALGALGLALARRAHPRG